MYTYLCESFSFFCQIESNIFFVAREVLLVLMKCNFTCSVYYNSAFKHFLNVVYYDNPKWMIVLLIFYTKSLSVFSEGVLPKFSHLHFLQGRMISLIF